MQGHPEPFSWPAPSPLSGCVARRRICAAGVVEETSWHARPHCFRALLGDGTGWLALVFFGRDFVPGISKGARMRVEGMVGVFGAELALLNPRYRFEDGQSPGERRSDA